jgi:hypothetical protein
MQTHLSLEQVLEGLSPGHLDTDSTIHGHIHNGLSNPNKLPDDPNIIDNSDLGQFTFTLQGVQHHAAQLESEITKTKCRKPKTY